MSSRQNVGVLASQRSRKARSAERGLSKVNAHDGRGDRRGDGRRGSLFYKVLVSLPSLPLVLLRWHWALGGPLLIGWTPLGEDSDCGHPVPRST